MIDCLKVLALVNNDNQAVYAQDAVFYNAMRKNIEPGMEEAFCRGI